MGLLGGTLKALRFLLLVLSMLVFYGLPAHSVVITPEVILMDPEADIQTAIDATPAGGILRLGPYEYVAPDSTGWFIERPITIEGAGIGCPDSASWGTMLRPHHGDTATPDHDNNAFTITGSGGVTLRNLMIGNRSVPAASSDSVYGAGVLIDATASRVVLENVLITHMGGFGVMVASPHAVTNLLLLWTDLSGNGRNGIWNNANVNAAMWPAYFDGTDWKSVSVTTVSP
jgi:hypothetical protein